MTIRAFIADDEPLARRKLRDLMNGITDVECIGEAADGPATIREVDACKPDLLFLDIRMPGASGLEVVDQLEHTPHVIFTTAYDKYAVTAFELQALDYLLKPFGERRFLQAVDRARRALESSGDDAVSTRARGALSDDGQLTRIFVRQRGKIIPVKMEDVQLFEAGDEYVTLHVHDRRHLVSVRLRDLEHRLDRERFKRIHRSYIVNLDFVDALTPYDATRLQVHLKSGATVVASRTRSRELRKMTM